MVVAQHSTRRVADGPPGGGFGTGRRRRASPVAFLAARRTQRLRLPARDLQTSLLTRSVVPSFVETDGHRQRCHIEHQAKGQVQVRPPYLPPFRGWRQLIQTNSDRQ